MCTLIPVSSSIASANSIPLEAERKEAVAMATIPSAWNERATPTACLKASRPCNITSADNRLSLFLEPS